jgi:hypothetical protein
VIIFIHHISEYIQFIFLRKVAPYVADVGVLYRLFPYGLPALGYGAHENHRLLNNICIA